MREMGRHMFRELGSQVSISPLRLWLEHTSRPFWYRTSIISGTKTLATFEV